jgi:hypothetical protein
MLDDADEEVRTVARERLEAGYGSGFSARAASAIKSTGVAFAYVNVLESPFIMER